MNPQTKPGWLTSEAWGTLITQVLAVLVLLGVVTPADSSTLSGALVKAVGAVATLAASAVTVWQYIQSRTKIKTQAPAEPMSPPPPETLPLKGG